ncbi:MAG: hypothetical protein M3Z46_07700 [Actinomycetota bacterium]|nr:hypothetical protein [Actinomycetota bacterium]
MAGPGTVDKKAAKKLSKGDGTEGKVLTYLRRSGTRKGFMGDSKPWLYIGAATWGYRLLRRLAKRKPEILLLEELKPGQRIIVSNDRPTVDVS